MNGLEFVRTVQEANAQARFEAEKEELERMFGNMTPEQRRNAWSLYEFITSWNEAVSEAG